MHAGLAAVCINTQLQTLSICYTFQTGEVILSALFKHQLSGSQLSSRWDKNVLSFKPFCSTGALHQFSHLHSRGDKEPVGEVYICGWIRGCAVVMPSTDEAGEPSAVPWRAQLHTGAVETACWGWGSRSYSISTNLPPHPRLPHS